MDNEDKTCGGCLFCQFNGGQCCCAISDNVIDTEQQSCIDYKDE